MSSKVFSGWRPGGTERSGVPPIIFPTRPARSCDSIGCRIVRPPKKFGSHPLVLSFKYAVDANHTFADFKSNSLTDSYLSKNCLGFNFEVQLPEAR